MVWRPLTHSPDALLCQEDRRTFLALSWAQSEADLPPHLIHTSITLGTSLIYRYLLSGRLPPQPGGLCLTYLCVPKDSNPGLAHGSHEQKSVGWDSKSYRMCLGSLPQGA